MHADIAQTPARRPPTVQSAISNGSKVGFGDGRKKHARRLKDSLLALSAECGVAFAELAPSDQIVVRRLAELSVQLEIQEARLSNGECVDGLPYLSLCNCQRRAMADFVRLKARLMVPRVPANKANSKRASTKQRNALTAFSFGGNP